MSDLQKDIDIVSECIAENPSFDMDAIGSWVRVSHAARRVANGIKEWLCQYPEFNDEACVVDHDPTQTRQPRKHSECGWFITIALGITTEDTE